MQRERREALSFLHTDEARKGKKAQRVNGERNKAKAEGNSEKINSTKKHEHTYLTKPTSDKDRNISRCLGAPTEPRFAQGGVSEDDPGRRARHF